jgi:predicted MFS family arabinose efflux permease
MPYRAALDWLSFFLADVRGGLGPYVGIFLLTEAHWDQAMIGGVLTISGLLGISLHTPVGALIDATRRKRELIIAGVVLLALSAVAIERMPIWPVVLTADIAMAVLGALFAPTLAAITLGLVRSHDLAARLGRNALFDRAGNLFVAGIAGMVGWWLSQRAVFYLVPLFAALTVVAVLSIPANAIDHERARGGLVHGADPGEAPHPAGWRILFVRRPFLVLAAGAALFHFANAPMLPLLGQKLALAHPGEETLLMSACIVTAQLVMIPMALLIGAKADRWGRKPLLLIALAALPIRGVLYTLSDDRSWLIGVQILDGVGLGLFDTLLPLVLADVMRGTGRYNVSRGVIGTIQGIGGSLSNGVAGLIVVRAGYDTAFLILAALAAMALFLVWVAMPETRGPDQENVAGRVVAASRRSP